MNRILMRIYYTNIPVLILFILGFCILSPQNLFSQAQNQKCLICHSKPDFKIKLEDGSIKLLYINDSLLAKSPHSKINCYDCHNDIVEITAFGHKKNVNKVQCTRCHYENNPVGAPETKKYLEFQESVHQQELDKGNPNAPTCQTCHGTHDIVKRKSLSALEMKKKIAQVCAKCHLEIYTVYKTSIHGRELFEKNNSDVPSCTDCHGEHKIKKHDDPLSTVYDTKIYKTCGECHASEKIVAKYGIDADKIKTYETSYHGIAGQFGEKTVANCSSCHGVHDIKPQDDPTSSINPKNIVHTCGKCHPDANANYTKGKIHLNSHNEDAGSIFYISGFFKWMTLITISLLAIHVLLDLFRKLKHKKH